MWDRVGITATTITVTIVTGDKQVKAWQTPRLLIRGPRRCFTWLILSGLTPKTAGGTVERFHRRGLSHIDVIFSRARVRRLFGQRE